MFFENFYRFMSNCDSSPFFLRNKMASFLLGKNWEEFRVNTTYSRRNTKWWEASLYRVECHTPVFLPTNLPRISHLDLEQHSHIFPEDPEDEDPMDFFLYSICSADVRVRTAKQNLFVDWPPSDAVELKEKSLLHMKAQYYKLVRFAMDLEYHQRVYKNLKAHWDVTRFKRFVNFCLSRRYLGPEIQTKCEMIVELLAAHCMDDSALVVHTVTKICRRYETNNIVFIDSLPSNLMQFFGKHLRQFGEFDDIFKEWFRREDLIIQAIYEGNTEKVKKLVEWKYPSGFLPFVLTPAAACFVMSAWPRQKNGMRFQSYYSLEYFSIFTTFLAVCVSQVMEGRFFGVHRLSEGFRMFWRSVPTPHLPFLDMSVCIQRMMTSHFEYLPFDEYQLKEILEGIEELLADEDEYHHDMYAPRSLQHLCRCAVRLMCPTPEGITALPVADRLKSYLCLDE